jgi:hypothetical protein
VESRRGWLRAFAVTGQIGYQFPTRSFDVVQNAFIPQVLAYGGSIQYSMPYLKSEIHDYQLPDFINHLIPIVEAQCGDIEGFAALIWNKAVLTDIEGMKRGGVLAPMVRPSNGTRANGPCAVAGSICRSFPVAPIWMRASGSFNGSAKSSDVTTCGAIPGKSRLLASSAAAAWAAFRTRSI